jgi:biotin carboxyl carrier protein
VPEAKRDGREPQRPKPDGREADGRIADHAEIGRLADVLLPALIAKLATTRLGELEVREGDWRVRLRRPPAADTNYGRRANDKPSRAQPGHEGHGHARGAPESATARATRLTGVGPGDTAGAAATTNGTGAVRASLAAARRAERDGNVAYSPAVGVFHPGARAAAGTRVRSGDALGSVDVLGVPQEVLAPADGIVATTLVEGGTAVEYGQELVRLELTAPAESR